MICRTQVAVQSTNSAMAALLMWPDESMTILALRLLTALRRCLFKRRSLTFSKGRKGRTLIVSFMMHLQVKVAKNSTWRCFTLLGAHQLSVTLPILPSRPYFNESCQLKTAVLEARRHFFAHRREEAPQTVAGPVHANVQQSLAALFNLVHQRQIVVPPLPLHFIHA